ncbi:MAG: hypothetical protein EOO05_15360 [Chitinophagaceae bacterium]|nr:MAG: hypothetical protein EOO05_15360 [Chitinophagaceae bacterium]
MTSFIKHLAFFLMTMSLVPAFAQPASDGTLEPLTHKAADSLVIHYLGQVDQIYFDKAKAVLIRKELTRKRKAGEFYEMPAKTLTDSLSRLLLISISTSV